MKLSLLFALYTEETKIEMDAEEFLANTVSLAGYV
jgi:hypothetical protein